MNWESTAENVFFSLRPKGNARYFQAAFLAVWLVGWAVGELLALWTLGWGVWQAVSKGQPPEREGITGWGSLLGAGIFMGIWLTIWTIGGLAAIREFLRLFWSEDRFILDGGGLKVVHCWGPFSSMQVIPRDQIHRFGLINKGRILVAYDEEEPIRLTTLGSPEDRLELLGNLEDRFVLSEKQAGDLESNLPADYRETVSPDGQMILIKNSAGRTTWARILTYLALVLLGGAAAIVGRHGWLSEYLAGAVVLGLFGGWAVWGAIWMAWGRYEWSFGPGRLVLRRRFRGRTREILQAEALSLQCTTDDDGDEWFTLRGITTSLSSEVLGWKQLSRGRDLYKLIHDEKPVRAFGKWLTQRTGLPFYDRTTPEAQPAELKNLREQLAEQGVSGRLVLKTLHRVQLDKKS